MLPECPSSHAITMDLHLDKQQISLLGVPQVFNRWHHSCKDSNITPADSLATVQAKATLRTPDGPGHFCFVCYYEGENIQSSEPLHHQGLCNKGARSTNTRPRSSQNQSLLKLALRQDNQKKENEQRKRTTGDSSSPDIYLHAISLSVWLYLRFPNNHF